MQDIEDQIKYAEICVKIVALKTKKLTAIKLKDVETISKLEKQIEALEALKNS